jgi:pimeloyl-ACP methyl ester carboxylesterase
LPPGLFLRTRCVDTAAAQVTRAALEALPDAERAALRSRHVHGDEQIAKLYEMTRAVATSHDDMAFSPALLGRITARTLIVHGDRDPFYPVERRWSCTAASRRQRCGSSRRVVTVRSSRRARRHSRLRRSRT